MDLADIKKIYFVGIGGIAMSAVASMAKQAGFEVEGSDSTEVYSPAKDVIDAEKLNYHVGYDEENVKRSGAGLFVFSAGESLENPEVKYIVENNLERVGFAELLYEFSKNHLRVVVTGTHGKTTTAGLLGHLFQHLDDSSFLAGGVLQNSGRNFYKGEGHYFIFEGDEYKNQFDDPIPKFHYYKPDILVLTNLEYDHPDLFSSFEELEKEFEQLIANLPDDGLLVYNADDINLSRLAMNTEVATVSFGIETEADFKVEHIEYGQYTKFEVKNRFTSDPAAKLLGLTETYQIQLTGKMNIYNSVAVIATLRALGFQPDQIALDLLTYQGIKRRFEVVSEKNNITLIDDYAHHPTAIRETLEAARLKYFSGDKNSQLKPEILNPKLGKLWAIFEPHTFSRTKATLPELVKAFDSADEILISEIYPAREKIKDATISSADVVAELNSKILNPKSQVRLIHNKQEALSIIKAEAQPGDVVVVMAVGDFNRLAYELKKIL